MYSSHSKDINRNKSFHPLTFTNLRRVEELKEKEEKSLECRKERQKELHRDQEERRYDELVLASSTGGLSSHMAHFKQVRNVFAAEYGSENIQHQSTEAKDSASEVPGPVARGSGGKYGNVLMKFTKAEPEGPGTEEPELQINSTGRGKDRPDKRSRDVASDQSSAICEPKVTGFVTTSEAAALRRELDLVKKQRIDPLRRVEAYQNSVVADAARRKELEAKRSQMPSGEDATKSSIRDHLRALLDLKNAK